MPHTITDADRYRWLRAAWLQGTESDAPSEMQRAIGYAETTAEMDTAIDAELQKPENAHLLSARAGDGKNLGDDGTVGLLLPDGRTVWGRPAPVASISECYGDCRTGDPSSCPYPCKFEGRPGSTLGEDDIDWPDVESMARSACEEAFAFGVGFDVFHRHMRAVMDKTAQAVRSATGKRLYAAEGRANMLALKLESANGCISGWVNFGSNVTEALGLRVMSPKAILAEISRLRAGAAPLPEGWKFNHAQQQTDEDGPVPGTWEIGWLDDEDSSFSAILVLDLWLYDQEDAAEPLARAILARLTAQFPPPATADGSQP